MFLILNEKQTATDKIIVCNDIGLCFAIEFILLESLKHDVYRDGRPVYST